MNPRSPRLGATLLDGGRCRFAVWAPRADRVEVELEAPHPVTWPLEPRTAGYFTGIREGVPAGARYRYRLTGADGRQRSRPDPCSRFQPAGVHGPSQVVAEAFPWGDAGWCGRPLSAYVIYELHVGTFTPEGTFAAVVPHLDALAELGVTALELMPVAQFPGGRNWGYDGVYPFAVQNTYGGPEGLKRLVDACHVRGLALILDVVYNHLGPEGNYLSDFAPYFTDFYRTPWGAAVNFDGPDSDEVRRYFVENALQWVDEFHIDALRLDAVHAILDFSARPFLEELGLAVRGRAEALQRRIHLIAESALNDNRIVRRRELGGFALDAQWNDDFHHSLHTALTDERDGYYQDFAGLEDLARAWREGWVYSGRHSRFRRRRHGNSPRHLPARRLVVFAQNHDQVGNRPRGDRLGPGIGFEKQKLAAGQVLLSPFIPLLFMGEEYGETAPFLYFVSHGDPDLAEAVREGRRREFASFDGSSAAPDPQDEETFRRSVLDRSLLADHRHRTLRDFHRELLRLRKALPELALLSRAAMSVDCDRSAGLLLIRRRREAREAVLAFNFQPEPAAARLELAPGPWRRRIDSADLRWLGPGGRIPETLAGGGDVALETAPHSLVLITREAGE